MTKTITKSWRVLALVTLTLLLMGIVWTATADPAEANDIFFSETQFATDYTSGGCGGMRTNGNCNVGITIAAVGGGTVTKALLYWSGPTNTNIPLINANVTFDGNAIVGANIGFSNDNCWGFQNSQAYVADVTALVLGDGTYTLSGFASGGTADTNGASLLVFYDDADGTNNRDIVLFHGNDSNIDNGFDAPGWNVSLPGINYSGGAASIELHVADGQTFTDDALILNAVTLVATGPIFQGDSVPGDNNGPTNNGRLWDIRSEDVSGFLDELNNPNALTLTTGVANDCLSLHVAVINLEAGDAPDQPLIEVNLDVHPTSCPNPVSSKGKGVIPVAILGTADFDVMDIDLSTVELEGVSPLRSAYEDVADPYTGGLSDPLDRNDCTTDGPDGLTDLTLKFDKSELLDALGSPAKGSVIEVEIVALTLGGTPIIGSDVIWIR